MQVAKVARVGQAGARVSGCHGRPLLPARRQHVALRATEEAKEAGPAVALDDGANMAAEYCSIDKSGKRAKRTLGEMEFDFLAALSSYYYDGKPSMTDEEFELLKEELTWAGSKVVVLEVDEQRFLEAATMYAKGKPIMSDAEYDELKNKLRASNSIVVAQGPRCSLDTKKVYSDATPDYLRMTALNIPATVAVLGVLFAADYFSGFELSTFMELPPPWGFITVWGLVLPAVYVLATSITNVAFSNVIILKAPCPTCGTVSTAFFGDILTVAGNRGSVQCDCPKCNATLTFEENKRLVVVDVTGEEKAAKAAARPAGKKKMAPKSDE